MTASQIFASSYTLEELAPVIALGSSIPADSLAARFLHSDRGIIYVAFAAELDATLQNWWLDVLATVDTLIEPDFALASPDNPLRQVTIDQVSDIPATSGLYRYNYLTDSNGNESRAAPDDYTITLDNDAFGFYLYFGDTKEASWKLIAYHELGHALGLEHPFERDDNDWDDFLDTNDSVMSYTLAIDDDGHPGFTPFDQAALASIHGAESGHQAVADISSTPLANYAPFNLSQTWKSPTLTMAFESGSSISEPTVGKQRTTRLILTRSDGVIDNEARVYLNWTFSPTLFWNRPAAAKTEDYDVLFKPLGEAVFHPGQATIAMEIIINGDTAAEGIEWLEVAALSARTPDYFFSIPSETLRLSITDPISPPSGTTLPTLSITALAARNKEGRRGTTPFTFRLSRSGNLSGSSTVQYTVSGSGSRRSSASASDFAGNRLPSGTVTFNQGEATATLTIGVRGDRTKEASERFSVQLVNPSNALLSSSRATGLIRNDDRSRRGGRRRSRQARLADPSHDRLTGNSTNPTVLADNTQIFGVLHEALGHHLDAHLNGSDHGTLTLDDRSVSTEFSRPSPGTRQRRTHKIRTTIRSISDNDGPITGNLSNGQSTDDSTPLISGTVSRKVSRRQKVLVYNGTQLLGKAKVNSHRQWFFSPVLSTNGIYSIRARVSGRGNPFSSSRSFALNTTPSNTTPAVISPPPVVSPPPVGDTTSPTLSISDNASGIASGPVTFSFLFSEPVSGFTANDITVSGGTKGTFTGSGSSYSLIVTPDANRTDTITVDVPAGVSTDAAGNGNAAATQASQVFDTQAPAAPSISSLPSSISNQSTVTLAITAEPGSDVTVLSNGSPLGSASESSSTPGSFSFSATALADGLYAFTATASDSTGNTSAPSGPIHLTIDTTAPEAPQLSSNTLSNDPTPLLSGTAEANSVLALSIAGATYATTASSNGLWSVDTGTATPSAGSLALNLNGTNPLSLTATDAAGNTSATTAQNLVLDTTSPTPGCRVTPGNFPPRCSQNRT